MAGLSYIMNGQFQEAEAPLKEVFLYGRDFGCDILKTPAQLLLGAVQIYKGNFNQGLKMIEDVRQSCLESERRWTYAYSEYVLGKVYLQIIEGAAPTSLSTVAKNIGFLIKNVPFASRKAEAHFNKAIEVAKAIGAKGLLGQAYVDLGLLHKTKKRTDKARDCISEAIKLFKKCEADVFVKQAKGCPGIFRIDACSFALLFHIL